MNLAETPAVQALPGVVQIEPVGRRKLMGSPPAFMTFDAFCRLVDALVPPVELHLHGEGEPLLHPRFFDMVAYAAGRGIDVTASTRLAGLSARRAEECVQSGLRLLRVLPGEPSPLAKRSLERLEEAKRKLKSALPEVQLLSRDAAPAAAPALRIAYSGLPVPNPPRATAP